MSYAVAETVYRLRSALTVTSAAGCTVKWFSSQGSMLKALLVPVTPVVSLWAVRVTPVSLLVRFIVNRCHPPSVPVKR